MGRANGEQAEGLSRMRRRLDEFRRGTTPGKAFPGWVWSAAAKLARRHGVHRTGRALGLEYNKLKRVSGGQTASTIGATSSKRCRAATAAVGFVELTGALPLAGACRLRMGGPAGQHLELEMTAVTATELVLGLCRAGWGCGA